MRYPNVIPAVFVDRPNRFIARCRLEDQLLTVHVKNTGRCRELLLPGASVWLTRSNNFHRKTAYDLIAVQKGDRLINMDAAAPNAAFGEYAKTGNFLPGATVRAEVPYGGSRFDFLLEQAGKCHFVEVKGVTLEHGGIVRFPDAPTERGVKHIKELTAAAAAGYGAHAVFIVQMADVRWLEPNDDTHPAFGQALREAAHAGVDIRAFWCKVTPDSMALAGEVSVRL